MLIFSFFTTRWVKNITVSKSSCANVEETGTSQWRSSNSFKNNKSPSSPTRWTRYECTWGENRVQIQQSHNACSCCVIYTSFSCFELLFLCFAQFGSSSHGLNVEKFHDTAMWVMRGHGRNCAVSYERSWQKLCWSSVVELLGYWTRNPEAPSSGSVLTASWLCSR